MVKNGYILAKYLQNTHCEAKSQEQVSMPRVKIVRGLEWQK